MTDIIDSQTQKLVDELATQEYVDNINNNDLFNNLKNMYKDNLNIQKLIDHILKCQPEIQSVIKELVDQKNFDLNDEQYQQLIFDILTNDKMNSQNNVTDTQMIKQNDFTFVDNLYSIAEETITPLLYSKCDIIVELTLGDTKVKFLIDTGAQSNVLSFDIAKKLNLIDYIDTRFNGIVKGVGQSTICGSIHYLETKMEDINGKQIVLPLNFSIINNDMIGNIQILGLSAMLFYKMTLDFRRSILSLEVDEQTYDIPMRINDH